VSFTFSGEEKKSNAQKQQRIIPVWQNTFQDTSPSCLGHYTQLKKIIAPFFLHLKKIHCG
jgi:hypothetical protein